MIKDEDKVEVGKVAGANSENPLRLDNSKSSQFCVKWMDPTGCVCSNFIFCSTGVVQVVLIQWLDYHGIDGAHTGLTVLSSYLGMLIFALPFMFSNGGSNQKDEMAPRFHKLFPVVIGVDVAANICNNLSIGMCGSMLFMVIYSSIIIFAAIIRWRLFGKWITRQQSLSLAIITVGLALTAFDGAEANDGTSMSSAVENVSRTFDVGRNDDFGNRALFTGKVSNSEPLDVPDPGRIIGGMVLALMGAFGYAVVYVLTEQVTIQKQAPDPFAFASFSGFYGSSIVASYIFFKVGPVWQETVIAPMEAKNTSYSTAALVYFILLMMCGAHNVSFVFLGKNGGGAVVAGVNKAVQTISVFVASAIFFGPEHPEQRMTRFKIVALILVVVGVLVYSAAPKASLSAKAKQETGGQMKMNTDVELSTRHVPLSLGKLSQRGRGGYSALQVDDPDDNEVANLGLTSTENTLKS